MSAKRMTQMDEMNEMTDERQSKVWEASGTGKGVLHLADFPQDLPCILPGLGVSGGVLGAREPRGPSSWQSHTRHLKATSSHLNSAKIKLYFRHHDPQL
jgi:hypothetical protein